jgi:hypothetical protein
MPGLSLGLGLGLSSPSKGGGTGLVDIAGPELVANGEFVSNINGWTDSSNAGGAISWSAGRLATVNTTGTARARTTVTVEVGKRYRFIARNFGAAGVVAVGTSAGGSQYLSKTTTAALAQIAMVEFVATATTVHIQLVTFTTGTTSLWDHVTVRELTATAFNAGTVFSDNFERPDGPLGVTPQNLPWRYIDPVANSNVFSRIESGIVTAPDSGFSTTASYNVLTLGRPVRSVHCDLSFLGATGAAIAMIGMQPANPAAPTVAEIVQNALHLVFTDTKVDVAFFQSGVYVIDTVNYSSPLARDGTVYPNVGWSLSGSVLTVNLPDGTTVTRIDARFAQVNGVTAIIEPYWASGAGTAQINATAIRMS